MRVTLSDVAARSGYSKSTVSIALRNGPRLPAETRELIKRIAAEMGYHPDPSLSAIAALRWRRSESVRGVGLAALVDSASPAYRVGLEYVRAFTARALALGYAVETFDIRAYGNASRLNRVLVERGIRGVLVAPVYDREAFTGIEWGRFAGVACGSALWRPPFHVVTTDVFRSVQLAFREVCACGYRRIGVAAFTHDPVIVDDDWRAGAALLEARRNPGLTVDLYLGPTRDETAALRWVRRFRPEAIISLHEALLAWLRGSGITVPDRLGFASLVGSSRASTSSGIDQQHARIGTTAAEMLDLEVRRNEIGPPVSPQTLLVTPEWRQGRTLRPIATVPAH
jgi:LacI family transcriptional regulator